MEHNAGYKARDVVHGHELNDGGIECVEKAPREGGMVMECCSGDILAAVHRVSDTIVDRSILIWVVGGQDILTVIPPDHSTPTLL